MKIAIIGRTEILYETAQRLHAAGHQIPLIITAPEAPEYKRKAIDFARMAERWGARFVNSARIADVEAAVEDESEIDVAISMNYSGILPATVTNRFALGVLNAHGGDLPRYRGNACQAWAIINGEERVGLCIHRMIGGELDSGDIIARDHFPVQLNTTVTHVWGWMAERIPTLYEHAIDVLSEDPAYVLEQQSKNPNDTLRCYPRTRDDGRIDWTRSAIEIARLVNASTHPYAGAYCNYESDELIIWTVTLVEEFERYNAVPGQITRIDKDFVEVATGDGKVRVHEVCWHGELCVPSTFIRSIRKRLG